MSYKVGISTFELQKIYGEKGAIGVAKKVGADSIDFFTNAYYVSNPDSIYSKSDEEIVAYFTELKNYAEELGVFISQTHGRLRIFMNEPELDRLCLENARRDLLAASAFGAPVCVMHGINTAVMGVNASPQIMRDLCYEKFSNILKWAKEYNVKLATESFGYHTIAAANEFFGNDKEFKNIFERISAEGDNADYFTVCVDTGHTNSAVRFGNCSVGDFIRMFPGKVSCLHLHDNDGINDQHRPVYCGVINWDDVFDALEEVRFNGVYNLEINCSCFGKGFELETAEFAIRNLKFALKNRLKQ